MPYGSTALSKIKVSENRTEPKIGETKKSWPHLSCWVQPCFPESLSVFFRYLNRYVLFSQCELQFILCKCRNPDAHVAHAPCIRMIHGSEFWGEGYTCDSLCSTGHRVGIPSYMRTYWATHTHCCWVCLRIPRCS